MSEPPANAARQLGEPSAAGTPQRRTIVLPDIDWVLIAGGEFLYQENERRTLPPFRIARYPLTNAQYETFVAAGGYDDARWWNELERLKYEASRWPQANRPRTNVSWCGGPGFSDSRIS